MIKPNPLRNPPPCLPLLLCLVFVAMFGSSASAEPTRLQVFGGEGKDPTESIVTAREGDLWFEGKKPYVECWFYLAVADDGTVFYCHFNLMKINWIVKQNSVDFGLNLPDGRSEFFANGFDDGATNAATDKLDIGMGRNSLRGTLARQQVHIEELGYVLDLTFVARVPAFREGDGKIWMSKEKDQYLDLTVQPAMRFEGTVSKDGKTRQLKGWGYSDHVVQSTIPTDFAKQIRSYRVSLGDVFISAMEYYPVPSFLPSRVPFLVVTNRDKVVHVSLDYVSKQTEQYTDPKTAFTVPSGFVLSDQGGSFRLECSARGKLVQRIDYLASVGAMLRKMMQWAGYRTYGYIFTEDTQCTVDSPEVSGTFSGKGVLEVLMSQ